MNPKGRYFAASFKMQAGSLSATVSALEARLVIHGRRGQRGGLLAEALLRLPVFEIVPPGAAELDTAYVAFITYDKGSGHPANLNFGDLFSYALAKVRGFPLLFKGNDFSRTDIQSAVPTAG